MNATWAATAITVTVALSLYWKSMRMLGYLPRRMAFTAPSLVILWGLSVAAMFGHECSLWAYIVPILSFPAAPIAAKVHRRLHGSVEAYIEATKERINVQR